MSDGRRRGPIIAEPLPECSLCEQPTRREAWEENGQLCTGCSSGIADTVRMLPVRGATVTDIADQRRRRVDRQEQLDETVFVERFLPPVPGQLELGEED